MTPDAIGELALIEVSRLQRAALGSIAPWAQLERNFHMIAIISRDAKPIGIADHEPQGVGIIEWFHKNAGGQSSDWYIANEGYSVEIAEEVDCHGVAALIGAICERAGITMTAEFVPFSQSRNAKPGKDGKLWRSLNWRVTFARHGREFLTTDYSEGTAHAPAALLRKNPDRAELSHMIAFEIERGKIALGVRWGHKPEAYGGKPIPAPAIGDVLQSLVTDASVIDAGGFENWAADCGYDTDSRQAELIYNACMEIAVKLRAALGGYLLAELQLAASFN